MFIPPLGEQDWKELQQEAPAATRSIEVAWRLDRLRALNDCPYTTGALLLKHEAKLRDIGYSILVNAMIHVGKDMARPGRAHTIRILASHIGRLAIEEGLYLQYAKGR